MTNEYIEAYRFLRDNPKATAKMALIGGGLLLGLAGIAYQEHYNPLKLNKTEDQALGPKQPHELYQGKP